MRNYIVVISASLFFVVYGCQESQAPVAPSRFTLLPASETGVDFRNDVPYSDTFNCYLFRNFYNGGGVGIGDVNNDGLPDLFFCGNMVSNKLYLNRGNFKFEDISEKAGLISQNVWTAGVAFADVNGDGWLDIYTCKSGQPDGKKRYNELFINNGDAAQPNGVPTFREEAAAWGLDNRGLSTHAAFFDYDRDGDLDCYLLNNSIRSVGGYDYRPGQRNIPDPNGGNKLLRNMMAEGGASSALHLQPSTLHPLPSTFKDVSREAGIYSSAIGFGLGVTVGDYDGDGWQDLFISNDFFERDYLYRNKGDGTFEEVAEKALPELSKGSMGADMADLNNDGFPEIFVTEMTPPDEMRYKTKAAFDSWNTYATMTHTGYHRQFARNVLQTNHGDGSFSERGRSAGVWATDWSWGALLADFDNDGWKDIFVANGIGKDLLDQDYLNFYSDPGAVSRMLKENPGQGIKKLIDAMPAQPLANFMFRNAGRADSLAFSDAAEAWGLATPSFSNGSAYGDLDNDGDLDLVVNNVNMPCFVYRNETNAQSNWLKIKLEGARLNKFALGAKALVRCGGQTLYQELAPMRGFESCVDYSLHFGLGQNKTIEEVEVVYSSGKIHREKNIAANQTLTLREQDAADEKKSAPEQATPVFLPARAPAFVHKESDFSDFDREPLLFRMYSAEGPKTAAADLNADGLDDLYVCGAAGQAGKLFLQQPGGDFKPSVQPDFERDKAAEDADAAFFDADGDGDLDLYVGSGSNEFNPGDEALQDRLYLNDGRGLFRRNVEALPGSKPFATACVRPADVDGDGDQDVFVGMRLVAGHYGQMPASFLLENDGSGHFQPVFQKYPALRTLGMVTDAAWEDLDRDGDPDLLVVGEWEPLRVFKNDNGRLIENDPGLGKTAGWWNCLVPADLDGDGDQDFILGNWGLNTRFKATPDRPLSMYAADFDQNGQHETIFCQYNGAQSYPLVQRNDLVKQLPVLKKKYLQFSDYQSKGIADMFTPEQLGAAVKKEAFQLQSSILWNEGGGRLSLTPLPYAAQQMPVFAACAADFDGDGQTDLVLAGNHERCKPETGIYLGSYGLFLKGVGGRKFEAVSQKQSGLKLEGVVRSLTLLRGKQGAKLVVGRNNGVVEAYSTAKGPLK